MQVSSHSRNGNQHKLLTRIHSAAELSSTTSNKLGQHVSPVPPYNAAVRLHTPNTNGDLSPVS